MNTATKEASTSLAADIAAQPPAVVERLPRPMVAVESKVPVLDTAMFEHMMRIAKVLANSGLVPAHLNAVRRVGGRDEPIDAQEALSNCFLVVNQAIRWRMDPFAVAQHTFVTKGKIGYEGKLIAAVINSHPMLIKRLSYRFDGESGKPNRKVFVTGRMAGEDEDREVEGTVGQWQTDNDNWKKSPDQMLTYRGAREWARRWMPEVILGVWGDDELEQFETTGRTFQAGEPQRGAAGLKQALQQSAAPQDGAGSSAGPATTGEPAAAAHSKPLGTLAQRDEFVKSFAACADPEILALKRDEARMFDWTPADQEVLDVSYSQRQDELARKG